MDSIPDTRCSCGRTASVIKSVTFMVVDRRGYSSQLLMRETGAILGLLLDCSPLEHASHTWSLVLMMLTAEVVNYIIRDRTFSPLHRLMHYGFCSAALEKHYNSGTHLGANHRRRQAESSCSGEDMAAMYRSQYGTWDSAASRSIGSK